MNTYMVSDVATESEGAVSGLWLWLLYYGIKYIA